jgi:hypothetical protein
MRKYDKIGVCTPDVYLPRPDVDMFKWAVIACDQFTSQPEYWRKVSDLVADAPSTYHLTLPEVYLGQPEEAARLTSIQQNMQRYLNDGILLPQEGMIYVERQVAGKTRKGVLMCLDLEQYDFNKGSSSLIRATEGTILDRLPPRIRIRENALLELPHILVLIDDPDRTVIEPLAARTATMQPVYDTDLMLGSGHIRGWRITDPTLESGIVSGLTALLDPAGFKQKYQLDSDKPVLLFAVGDGNHSLATAKAIWERLKPAVGMDHPARYALVEIENVHDAGLEFEPIHRVLFQTTWDMPARLKEHFPGLEIHPVADMSSLQQEVAASTASDQRFGLITPAGFSVARLHNPGLALPVGNLQVFLDGCLKDKGAAQIDYVHGADVVERLGRQSGNTGFYLPAMAKTDLFRTVILDGALPRKTFSMGEAIEKRFYIEARKIK